MFNIRMFQNCFFRSFDDSFRGQLMMMKTIVTLMVTMMNMMVIADDFSTDKITTHKHVQKNNPCRTKR